MNYVLDVHTHTLTSGHAYSTIKEMAEAASEQGLQLLGITEHAPIMDGAPNWIYFSNLRVVPRQMYGVELMLGVELNIIDYDGHVDLDPAIMERVDLRIASLHDLCIASGTLEQNTNATINAIMKKVSSVNFMSTPSVNGSGESRSLPNRLHWFRGNGG